MMIVGVFKTTLRCGLIFSVGNQSKRLGGTAIVVSSRDDPFQGIVEPAPDLIRGEGWVG
jgi:hypothetical protein